MGSSLYKVNVTVVAVPEKQWQSISADCAGSIDSLVELLQGRLSKAVMERICRPNTGLFPAPKEIQFSCSCPDWASMCKHVAAVLYGVGARLDSQPELIFALRRVDAKDLVAQAGAGLPRSRQSPTTGKVLDDAHLADVFGIEMADAPAKRQRPPAASRRQPRWPPQQPARRPRPGRRAPPRGKQRIEGPRLPLAGELPSLTTRLSGRPLPVGAPVWPAREGGSFLVRDDRQRPHFYIRAADAAQALAAGAPALQPDNQEEL